MQTPNESIFKSGYEADTGNANEVLNTEEYIGMAITHYKNDLANPHEQNHTLFGDSFSVILYDDNGNNISVQGLNDRIKLLMPLEKEQEVAVTGCSWWNGTDWSFAGCDVSQILEIGA